jgi:hypothetical protein
MVETHIYALSREDKLTGWIIALSRIVCPPVVSGAGGKLLGTPSGK